MSEKRITQLEINMGQIGVELKYITEKLDKIVDRLEGVTSTQNDVEALHNKIRDLETNQESLRPLIFLVKYPRLTALILAGLYSLSYSEVRQFILGF